MVSNPMLGVRDASLKRLVVGVSHAASRRNCALESFKRYGSILKQWLNDQNIIFKLVWSWYPKPLIGAADYPSHPSGLESFDLLYTHPLLQRARLWYISCSYLAVISFLNSSKIKRIYTPAIPERSQPRTVKSIFHPTRQSTKYDAMRSWLFVRRLSYSWR